MLYLICVSHSLVFTCYFSSYISPHGFFAISHQGLCSCLTCQESSFPTYSHGSLSLRANIFSMRPRLTMLFKLQLQLWGNFLHSFIFLYSTYHHMTYQHLKKITLSIIHSFGLLYPQNVELMNKNNFTTVTYFFPSRK